MNKYNPKEIEKKWQKTWEKEGTFEVAEDPKKKKFYGLIEFPYPSGAGLHVGHPRPFTAMDVITRKKRMEGFNVLYPIGFDAFGLPTENYAIKTGRPPAEVTAENIANFIRQLKSLGYGFDWSRCVDTTDPKYFKWTQWIFLQLFKHGLAYKKNQPINWCPKDKIGLANEEVVQGCCERCGTAVEQRNKEQWMLAITKYADKLLEGLKEVDYIAPARIQQENWIGKSEGAEVTFALSNADVILRLQPKDLTVFTTRPDTIFGVTYVAVSAELAKSWLGMGWKADKKVVEYIETTLKEHIATADRDEAEKTGIAAGFTVTNPANGEEAPVWITNYVMGGVGTGAIMGVPGHDERDFEFAKKFGLAIKPVVVPEIVLGGSAAPRPDKKTSKRDVVTIIIRHASTGKYLLLKLNDGHAQFVGGGIEKSEDVHAAALREIIEETGYTEVQLHNKPVTWLYGHGYKAKKDVNCYDFDTVLFAEITGDTQVALSDEDRGAHQVVWFDEAQVEKAITKEHHVFMWKAFQKKNECYAVEGISINSGFLNGLTTAEAKKKMIAWLEEKKLGQRKINFKLRDWVFSRQRYWGEPIPLVFCEVCAKNKKFDSKGEEMNPGWIPLEEKELPLELPKVKKYEPTDNGESPLAAMDKWVNTKCPRCGGKARRETDTMPNWAGSSWYFLRYVDPKNNKVFASKEKLDYWMAVDWYNGGMEHTVLHLLYSRFWNQFLYDLGLVPTMEPYKKRTSHGMILGPDGEKMSKSRGNVINPDEMTEQFGSDAFRTYIMFMGPFDQFVQWDTNGLVGVRRFMERVWNLQEYLSGEGNRQVVMHQTIKKVSEDIDKMSFNTAIAKMMELANHFTKEQKITREEYEVFAKLISPFAPHMADEIWTTVLGHKKTLAHEAWPMFKPELTVENTLTLAVQVNGKVRDNIDVAADITEEAVKELVMQSEKVQKWLEGKTPKKIIYVKGKLVSIVL